MLFHIYFLFPLDQERLFIKIGLGYFPEEYGTATAIGGIPGIHADISAFQEFFIAGPGVLEKAGHDTDIPRLIAYFQQLYLLQEHFACFRVNRTVSCGFPVKNGGKIGIGDGFQGLVALCDLDFELIAVVKQ